MRIPPRLCAGSVRLTAVTSAPYEYLYKLYREERNEDAPSELDPATADAFVRLRICEDISNSGIFYQSGRTPVDMREIHAELKQPRYSSIFHLIYRPTESQNPVHPYEYVNHYILREFELIAHVFNWNYGYEPLSINIKEYVFACLLRDDNSNEIVHFYVSKAYNVFHDRRYVFPGIGSIDETNGIMLAEGSAEVYESPDFNVELHYLELRKHHHLAESYDRDPVCKMTEASTLEDNAMFRFCTIVLGASYFKTKIKYLRRTLFNECIAINISFRTVEAIKEAAENLYTERVILCYATMTDGRLKFFFISRAYNPNQVFVYTRNLSNQKVYIENLSINVAIVHKRYNFDDVEI